MGNLIQSKKGGKKHAVFSKLGQLAYTGADLDTPDIRSLPAATSPMSFSQITKLEHAFVWSGQYAHGTPETFMTCAFLLLATNSSFDTPAVP